VSARTTVTLSLVDLITSSRHHLITITTTSLSPHHHLTITIALTSQDVKPTFFFAVPRVWEKMMEKMVQVSTSLRRRTSQRSREIRFA
jgi:long-subunit acyl-CoA synthetase (AMP-forming)